MRSEQYENLQKRAFRNHVSRAANASFHKLLVLAIGSIGFLWMLNLLNYSHPIILN